MEILRLIERLVDIHHKAQGVITPPHLSTALMYDLSRRWSLYLNMCMAASYLEVLESPGSTVTFTMDTILIQLECGRYVSTIIPGAIVDLIVIIQDNIRRGGNGSRVSGGSGSGGGKSGGNVHNVG